MKVRELIEQLEEMPLYDDVFVWNEKEDQDVVSTCRMTTGNELWPRRPEIKRCVVLET